MVARADTVVAGRYRLGQLLGSGGMADVYDAVDDRLDRPVAVKVLRPAMAARADVRRRFEAEARSAARLSHPNAVAVFDSGEDADGMPWLVMERMPGETLADRMAMAGGPMDVDEVRRIGGDVLAALGAAHAAGLVHRDVKPGNILIGTDGCAKVADFGIAKSIEVDGDQTSTGQLIGTPAYLAPERIDGEAATVRSDLYAVGVVLYEALAGKKPFAGATPVAIAYAVQHTDPPPLPSVAPHVPRAMADAIARAMERDPARRFDSAAAMAAALRGDDDATVVAPLPPADHTVVLDLREDAPSLTVPAHAVEEERRRRPWVAVAGGVVLTVLLLIGVIASSDRSAAGTDLDRVAASLTSDDGPQHAAAADRLRALAGMLDDDDPDVATEANRLLGDLANWQATGGLTAAAAARAKSAVLTIPGADAAAFAPPTTAPPAPPSTVADRDDDGDDDGKGKKKGHKGHDD